MRSTSTGKGAELLDDGIQVVTQLGATLKADISSTASEHGTSFTITGNTLYLNWNPSAGLNTPTAGVIGEPGMEYNAGSDEFGGIRFTSPPTKAYKIGDLLEVIVPHCDPVVNEYDQMYGIRNEKVEVVWPITARGKSQ